MTSILAMRNYTTTIDSNKTITEIVTLLSKRGKAESIIVDYGNEGQPEGIMFVYRFKAPIGGKESIPFRFRLPCRWEGVLIVLKRESPPRYRTPIQARRVAWRLLKDWLDAQLCLIEAGASSLPEVFLPFCIDNSKQTFYEAYLENRKQLNPPKS